jgi:microcompartment protein CcmK/EutM
MIIARVIAECKTTIRDPDLEAIRLVICETPDKIQVVAATELPAEVGDTVALLQGEPALHAFRIPNLPVDCAVCAVLSSN